ncbi:MAG: hypothetical protein V4635_06710 [Bacteroidota bacterium]
MKKLIYTLCFVLSLLAVKAQYWNTSLNAGSTLKLGTSSSDPINFYSNNRLLMRLSANGVLKLDSLAGSSYGLLYADPDGNLGKLPNTVPGRPCIQTALPWSQGGNNYLTYNTIGTCSGEDFILMSANIKQVFVTTSGFVGVGVDNTAPTAALDISDNSNLSNQIEHMKIFGDMNGTIESTSSFNLNYASNGGFYVNQGTGAFANKFSIYNGIANMSTDLKVSGKTNVGSQTNAPNSAKLNLNLNSTNTGASADNALDVYDQSSQKVNFRVKASGYTYAKEINVQLTTFPDYVFSKDYELESLESLEKYIKQNKHLPNVPTAADVEKNGANLGELSRIQMEKIEELTLYVIELKKEIDDLKKQMNNK